MDPALEADVAPLLVEELYRQVGDDLRTVARYDGQAYDLVYVREDVEERYTPDELDAVFDDLVLQGLHKDLLEGLFRAGELECSVLQFEEAVMFNVVPGDGRGLFVSTDAGAGVEPETVAATCRKHL